MIGSYEENEWNEKMIVVSDFWGQYLIDSYISNSNVRILSVFDLNYILKAFFFESVDDDNKTITDCCIFIWESFDYLIKP